MKPPARLIIFALVGPAVGLGGLALLAAVEALLHGRAVGATSAQVLRIFQFLLSPRWLLILAPFVLASWVAAALSLKTQAEPGRSAIVRVCAALGSLLLVSPISMLLAIVGFGSGPVGLFAAAATSAAALVACLLVCRLNERLIERSVSDAFA